MNTKILEAVNPENKAINDAILGLAFGFYQRFSENYSMPNRLQLKRQLEQAGLTVEVTELQRTNEAIIKYSSASKGNEIVFKFSRKPPKMKFEKFLSAVQILWNGDNIAKPSKFNPYSVDYYNLLKVGKPTMTPGKQRAVQLKEVELQQQQQQTPRITRYKKLFADSNKTKIADLKTEYEEKIDERRRSAARVILEDVESILNEIMQQQVIKIRKKAYIEKTKNIPADRYRYADDLAISVDDLNKIAVDTSLDIEFDNIISKDPTINSTTMYGIFDVSGITRVPAFGFSNTGGNRVSTNMYVYSKKEMTDQLNKLFKDNLISRDQLMRFANFIKNVEQQHKAQLENKGE